MIKTGIFGFIRMVVPPIGHKHVIDRAVGKTKQVQMKRAFSIIAKFDSIVAFSELERFIDQKIKNYSSGMQVRLAFSVAIHANREILLMDEVLAVGDSNFQAKCLREFARYKEMGKTVVLVTHDIATVQKYCDRAMLLRNGEVAMIDSAEKVGNEYIYQNMSDEEKRAADESKKVSSQSL